MASLKVIAKYLALFHELYPTRDVTDVTTDAWEYACSDLGDVAFAWGCDRLLKEPGRTFFPTPNEIRSHLADPRAHTDTIRLNGGDVVNDAVDDWYAKGGARQLWAENEAINAENARKYPQTWAVRP